MPNLFNVFLILIIILILIEIIPYFITICFPNLSYGSTQIGKLQQFLNSQYNLSYINWFAYIFLFLYLIYLSSKIENKFIKYSCIFFCLFIIYLPLYPILNIITIILIFVYKNSPFIKNYHDIFPQAYNIEKKSNTIINEFKEYYSKYEIMPIKNTNPGFTIEDSHKEENAWRGIFLKKTGKINNEMIKYFPETINLLKNDEIHSAFFSILDPEVEITPHVGYYKGYLRYHLGIVIPNNEINDINKKAYIVCGNERYYWKTGEGVMFDDMYLHYVKNPTQNMRCVLYLDIKRKSDNILIDTLNNIGIFLIDTSIILNLFLKYQHNQVNIKNPCAIDGGANELAKGPCAIDGGANELVGGPCAIDGGANELAGGPGAIDGGANELVGGPCAIDGGANELAGSPCAIDGGANELAGGPCAIDGGANELAGGPGAIDGGANELAGGPGAIDGVAK